MIFVEHKLSQSRRILSILMIIFLFVVVVANSNTSPALYGNKIHLLCTLEKPISGCRYVIPGETFEIQLFENRKSLSEKYEYFGKGFETGECGITIYNVTKENMGIGMCILTDYNNSEQSETVEVKIFDYNNLHMGLPKLKIVNSGPLKVSQTLTAECIVRSTNEYSNISWLLDKRVLKTFKTEVIKKNAAYELRSILKHQVDTFDNGRILKCRSRLSNTTQEFIDSTIELMVLNNTSLGEPKIGFPYDISIRFYAFPRVLSSRWRVNKRIIYYGVATNEFVSRELNYLKANQWEAVLRITNVTETNIHYNYTLQVDDKNGSKFYDVRLDNFTEEEVEIDESLDEIEQSTTSAPLFINISDNTITSSPEILSTKQNRYQEQKAEKSNTFIRRRKTTTAKSSPNNNSTTIHPTATERRTKYIRKKNTSMSITEMTSVIYTTTTHATTAMTKENTNETTTETASIVEDEKNLSFYRNDNDDNNNGENSTFNLENELKQIIITTITTTTERSLIEKNSTEMERYEATVEQFFIRISFITMTLTIIIFLFMLRHYRHQVAILKNEIIQMNLENYYNQSCLYPSTFNDYSSTNFQQNDEGPFYIKRPLNVAISDSGDSDQLLTTYSTNSHLYQSIDTYDIENHVYDEIVHQAKEEGDEEKPNNYENNESFNNVNEMLIPSHCHTLMTIHEEEELEASQIQILSNLESTYI